MVALAQAENFGHATELAIHDNWGQAEIKKFSTIVSPLKKNPSIVDVYDIAWYWGGFKVTGDSMFLDKIMTAMVNSLATDTAISDKTQFTLIQSLYYHMQHDDNIKRYFSRYYERLDNKLQSEIDVLLIANESAESELDCE